MKKINYVVGDATYPQGEGQKIIVHCCNNVGAWGAGFVLALNKRWTEPRAEFFASSCSWKGPELGSVQFVRVEPDIRVANIIGQSGVGPSRDGRPPIRYDAVRTGMKLVAQEACEQLMHPASIHGPRLGAGLAGGDWKIIEEILTSELCSAGLDVTIYDLPEKK